MSKLKLLAAALIFVVGVTAGAGVAAESGAGMGRAGTAQGAASKGKVDKTKKKNQTTQRNNSPTGQRYK